VRRHALLADGNEARGTWELSASAGAVTFQPDVHGDLAGLMKAADAAMYATKHRGR